MCTTVNNTTFITHQNSTYLCDHVHGVIFARVKHFKIMFQNILYTYYAAEDAELATSNYIKCGIKSHKLNINMDTSTLDKYKGGGMYLKKPEVKEAYKNINYIKREKELKRVSLKEAYKNYIKNGYVLKYNRNDILYYDR